VWMSGKLRDNRMNRDVSEYVICSGFAEVSVW
jgi:hypothetical protein